MKSDPPDYLRQTKSSGAFQFYKVYQQNRMKELGVKVLSKIQNLISEIEKPQPPRPNSKKQVRQYQHHQIEDAVSRQPHQATRSQHYANKMSYGYLDREKKTLSKLITHSYQVEHPVEPFRITNKQTIEILKKKEVKPIYQRLDDVINRKQMHINLLLQQKSQKEQDSMLPETYPDNYSPEDLLKKYRKMNQQDLQQFRDIYDQKNHLRLKKRHLHQLSRIDKETAQAVPAVCSHSKSLSKIRNLKKNYSADVFKRLNQDYLDRGGRKSQLLSKIVEEEGGFKPVLCGKSLVLAQQSKSNRSLFQNTLSNSNHKKCKASISYTPPKKQNRSRFSNSFKQGHSLIPINMAPSENKAQNKTERHIKDRQPPEHKQTNVKGRSPLKAQSKSNRLLNALKERDRNENLKKQEGVSRIDSKIKQNKSNQKQHRSKLTPAKEQRSKAKERSQQPIINTSKVFGNDAQKTAPKTLHRSVKFEKSLSPALTRVMRE